MKVICPNPDHKEDTASFNIYPSGWGHCFGCGYRAKVAEGTEEIEKYVKPEDLHYSLTRIANLPKKTIRGLDLPYDDIGYYIVWPDNSYYKVRLFDSSSHSGKYRGAKGITKPWYKWISGQNRLIIVEGELNAKSLIESVTGYDVISPGGSGDFYSTVGKKEVQALYPYNEILVIVDKDAAGAKAGIEVKSLLVRAGHDNVKIELWETDANSILEIYGKEELKKRIGHMDVPSKLCL